MVRIDIETIRKNSKEILEIKKKNNNTVIEMKNAFEQLNTRLGTAEEKSVYLNVCQEKPTKLKCKEENKKSKQNSRTMGWYFLKMPFPFKLGSIISIEKTYCCFHSYCCYIEDSMNIFLHLFRILCFKETYHNTDCFGVQYNGF